MAPQTTARLSEFQVIEDFLSSAERPGSPLSGLIECNELARIQHQDSEFPILGLTIGSKQPDVPVLGLFGGVHGVERIGAQVVVSFLNSLVRQMSWVEDIRRVFENFRIISIPVVNPIGIYRKTRCNGNGIDLMRNAPVDAIDPTFMVSGHRISKHLPWYRGVEGQPMEKEAQTLVDFVQEQTAQSPVSIAMDIHSGFGIRDRLWYPFAKSKKPFPRMKPVLALKGLLDESLPNHIYKVEPQSDNYRTHGDLWDYLYELHEQKLMAEGSSDRIFLPLTLEMGSWNWVKKFPIQFFSFSGWFNPVKPHRHARVMRRHLNLIWFLLYAAKNSERWYPTR